VQNKDTQIKMEEISYYWEKGAELAMNILPNLALAIFVLIAGFWVIKRLTRLVERSLKRANFSKEITPFILSFMNIGLKVLLLLSVAGIIGIETASLVAVMAAAGFAVGLALQGSLSNFAAGIIILVFRPYSVDDWIEIDEKFGKVESIQIFNTVIVTPGSKTLIIPNGQVINNIVTNYSSKGYIRMELEVTMPYEESFPKVKEIIEGVLRGIPDILQDPAPEVGILDYDSHSIIVGVRPYVKPDDFWDVRFESYRGIKSAFHQHSIKVAYSEGVELGRIGD
jgi:small conductance mechanosensitive channel